ncbi:MAG: sigma-54 dependent transcriptional regulator [Candidatus Wallbacteria bacterium]|nr:sigma-54 dependent transcriptional regulator [Candidatus Wallbacteria bacterium]
MARQPVILIVDDETIMLNALADTLKTKGYSILTAGSGNNALKLLAENEIDLVISDLRMNGMSGLDLLARTRELSLPPVFIVMTAYGTVAGAVDAIRQGAFDFIEKPFTFDKIEITVERALQTRSLIRENTDLKKQLAMGRSDRPFIGNSRKMKEIIDLVERVAELNITVLITGESGSGKEVVADAIHNLSSRSAKPFIKVNCAALPETLLESELFGHTKGAFTGAVGNKKGRFELADGGSIFLDEIGEVTPAIQVKLLRVLQEKIIEPLGSEKSISVDVRLITATNRDLQSAIVNGTFREDLYYRLNVINIRVPALRERREDIPPLVNLFLEKYSHEMKKEVNRISPDAMKILIDHNWPGNIRELENAIQRAIVLCSSGVITPDDLIPSQVCTDPLLKRSGDSLEAVEHQHISTILHSTGWNISRSAEILGIDRKTLYNKIQKYGLAQNGKSH